MRKSISFYLLPFLFIVLCLSSCSKTEKKTEYTHAIPANATEVAALDLTSIVDKAGLNNSDTQATLQKLLGLLLEGGRQPEKRSGTSSEKSRQKWNRLERSGLRIRSSYATQYCSHFEDCRFKEI